MLAKYQGVLEMMQEAKAATGGPLSGIRLKIGKVTLTAFVLARISVKPQSQICQRSFHVRIMFGVCKFQAFLSLQSKLPCCRHGVAPVSPP
jgi:hypothetical protein